MGTEVRGMVNATTEDARELFHEEFDEPIYPVTGATSLIPALSNGPMTRFEIGEKSLSAMELSKVLDGHEDFPYEDVDALVDDIVVALEAEGIVSE